MTIYENFLYNSSLWELSLLRLNQLGYFEEIRSEDVQIKMSATEPEPMVDINLTVKEKGHK